MNQARAIGLAIVLVGLFICSIFCDKIKKRSNDRLLQAKTYDLTTCSLTDYSVKVDFTDQWIERFNKLDPKTTVEEVLKEHLIKDLK